MNNCYIMLIIWNVAVFALYGADKVKSIRRKRRIRESTLIGLSFLMGGGGALLGMLIFRHKIRKPKFLIAVPLAAILNCFAVFKWLS